MFYPVKRNSGVVYSDPFDHIFEQFFGGPGRSRQVEARLDPQFEIAETENEYTVAAELPGIGKECVEIMIDDGVLSIHGEKKVEERKEGESYLFSERRYGAFERKFQLPETVKEDGIEAQYENGVLRLTLPKKPEAKALKARKIKVK